MTPEERAEKILAFICRDVDWGVEFHEKIAAQIREAEIEAGEAAAYIFKVCYEEKFKQAEQAGYERGIVESGFRCHEHSQKEYEKGFLAARDMAAKLFHEAMSIWLASYAPEECSKGSVDQASKVLLERGGTLAYIASSLAQMRALQPQERSESEEKR